MGRQLASGGNDNIVFVWDQDPKKETPQFIIRDHKAAVKALAWCPWQDGLLATGWGLEDGTVKLYRDGTLSKSFPAYSQVTGIVWSKNRACPEIATSHAIFDNSISVWKIPNLTPVREVSGHTSRILCLTQSPDGMVCSGGADETLRFWRLFSKTNRKEQWTKRWSCLFWQCFSHN